MAPQQLLERLDQLLEITDAFSPLFLGLMQLRTEVGAEAVIAAEPWDDPNFVEARYQQWLIEQEARLC